MEGSFSSRVMARNTSQLHQSADTVLIEGRIVNVDAGIIEKANVAIKGSRISRVGYINDLIGKNTVIVKVDGYLCPGFIDAHDHIDDTLLPPSVHAQLAIPHGTLAIIEDPHEIANALGDRGVEIFMQDCRNTLGKIFIAIPSSVPSVPCLETAPKITAEHAKNWIKNSNVVGLAEVMDDEGVLSGKNQNVLQMIRVTLQNRKIVDGHFSNCEQERLQAYIASGILTDHQAIRPEKVAELIKRGAWVMLNGGRLISGKDKKTRGLLDTVVREGLDIGHCMLCTDDRHAGDIHRYGLMDYNVTQAVRAFEHAGVGREEAFINSIRMATRNAAECYRLNMDIGTIAPGRTADIIEVKTNLKATKKQFIMKVKRVILDGKLVAKNGELLVKPTPYKYPSWATNSVKIKPSFNLNDLHVKPRKGRGHRSVAKVRISQGWHDFSRVNRIQQLPIENGYIKPDIKKDIVKVVVAERHGINGNTGVGFLHGTGLKRGAIATTLSHDSHNLTAIGIKDEDIFYAIRELTKMQGGMIVVENETVLAKLALPIAGLMTGNLRDAIGGQRRIRDAARALGLKPPFLREFGTTLGLTAYPGTGTKERTKWTITDKGLVEYPTCKMLQVVV